MRSDARPKAHLCGVSWRQPPAQQAEVGEGERAADSAAPFSLGDTHPTVVGRGTKERPGVG